MRWWEVCAQLRCQQYLQCSESWLEQVNTHKSLMLPESHHYTEHHDLPASPAYSTSVLAVNATIKGCTTDQASPFTSHLLALSGIMSTRDTDKATVCNKAPAASCESACFSTCTSWHLVQRLAFQHLSKRREAISSVSATLSEDKSDAQHGRKKPSIYIFPIDKPWAMFYASDQLKESCALRAPPGSARMAETEPKHRYFSQWHINTPNQQHAANITALWAL